MSSEYNDFVNISPGLAVDPWAVFAAKGATPHDLGAGDLVRIEWDDATQPSHGWVAPGDIDPTPAICHSVGWIVHKDERAITLASTKCDGGEVMGAMRIPAGTVRKITALTP